MGLDASVYGEDEQKLAHMRIGNFSLVVFLREAATQLVGEQSVVVSKILYNAFHCGDSLAKEDLEPLSTELLGLKNAAQMEVQNFAGGMMDLVQVALKNETTITF